MSGNGLSTGSVAQNQMEIIVVTIRAVNIALSDGTETSIYLALDQNPVSNSKNSSL